MVRRSRGATATDFRHGVKWSRRSTDGRPAERTADAKRVPLSPVDRRSWAGSAKRPKLVAGPLSRRATRAGCHLPNGRRSGPSAAGVLVVVAVLAALGPMAQRQRAAAPAADPGASAAPAEDAAAREAFGKLPMSFEANLGQTDAQVKFFARTSGSTVFLTQSEAVLVFARSADGRDMRDAPEIEPPDRPLESAVVRMGFVGADLGAQVRGEEIQRGVSNYFLGDDPSKWVTGAPNYSRVRYENLWPGIDLVFYENAERALEYDFVVVPGADPNQIALAFQGAEGLRVTDKGELAIAMALGEVVQKAPIAFQDRNGERIPIDSAWRVDGGDASFALGDYDRSRPLVIDPVLVAYSTFLGGGGRDEATAIAVDSSGAAYIAGSTNSTDFPTAAPFQAAHSGGVGDDVFVTKVDATGTSKVYSSYLGGTDDEGANAVAVDSSGSAYLAGPTFSADFPSVTPFQVTIGGSLDAFVTKVNPAGSAIAYSSFLGGTGAERAWAIAVDSSGSAYVAGDTTSAAFPTDFPFQVAFGGGSYDAFVTKVNPLGNDMVYSSFLGGSTYDWAFGIAVDSSGAAYVAGYTGSTNFPTNAPFQAAFGGGLYDAFVTKVNSAGSGTVYSSYLGGSADDEAMAVAVDSTGAAYLAGTTNSANFPTTSPFQAAFGGGSNDAFVTKVSADGSSKAYSSYLGGSDYDRADGVAVDASGAAHLTGDTGSADFPVASPFQGVYGGTGDAFVAKVNAPGTAKMYASFLGGDGYEAGDGIAVDSLGGAYVAGSTDPTDFPMTSPFQGAYGGGSIDALVAKVTDFPRRANTTSAGAQSVGPAQRPSISNPGRYVAFHSPVTDLVAGDNNGAGDVFVKDTLSGTIERASVTSSEAEASGGSRFAWITPDGRYVAFLADAPDLVAGDSNGAEDIFVRDRTLGTTERVNISTSGTEAASGKDSRFPQITPDGRYVVFQSQAPNLVAADTNNRWDIFVRDRTLGTTERVSLSSAEVQGNNSSARPSISDDGRYVAFHSWATNFAGSDTNGKADVFVRDRTFGTTTRVSVDSGGAQANDESNFPRISGDGSTVAFHSTATNLVGSDTNAARDTFVHETTGTVTTRVSVATGGTEADGATGYAAISGDGRHVAFHGTATNLVSGDTNGQQDVFVRDRTAGTTKRVSLGYDDSEGNGLSGSVAISADGGYLAYHSTASNLVPGDTNAAQDVFYTARP